MPDLRGVLPYAGGDWVGEGSWEASGCCGLGKEKVLFFFKEVL